MLTFRDFVTGFRKLEIDPVNPVIAHACLPAFGDVHGGVETVLGALLTAFSKVIMPAFTYRTMIIPEIGPLENALVYGSGKDTNIMAEIYRADLRADIMMGTLAEALRLHPKAQRSMHPILSFTGVNAKNILDAQTIKDPLLPIQSLRYRQGWVLLMGADQTANTSIHYGEYLAGRKQFIRWALTSKGIQLCPGFPGCSDGFEAVSPHLGDVIRKAEVGEATIQAIPIANLVDMVCELINADPLALLCEREDCERCNTIRGALIEL